MPYVSRDADGNINGMYENEQEFTSEFLPENDPAVVAFKAQAPELVSEAAAAPLSMATDNTSRIDELEARLAAVEEKLGITPATLSTVGTPS